MDLAHVSDQVMHDALDVASAPVIFSHSSVRSICDKDRNVPDDVLSRVVSDDIMTEYRFEINRDVAL